MRRAFRAAKPAVCVGGNKPSRRAASILIRLIPHGAYHTLPLPRFFLFFFLSRRSQPFTSLKNPRGFCLFLGTKKKMRKNFAAAGAGRVGGATHRELNRVELAQSLHGIDHLCCHGKDEWRRRGVSRVTTKELSSGREEGRRERKKEKKKKKTASKRYFHLVFLKFVLTTRNAARKRVLRRDATPGALVPSRLAIKRHRATMEPCERSRVSMRLGGRRALRSSPLLPKDARTRDGAGFPRKIASSLSHFFGYFFFEKRNKPRDIFPPPSRGSTAISPLPSHAPS